MPEGHGTSLGEALMDLTLQSGGRYSTYQAKGWHAQLSALTATARGRAAADAAGLSPSMRTLTKWLAEQQTPNAANRERIREAYESTARRPFPQDMKTGTLEISGLVATGRDVRDRGARGRAPLRIDAEEGDWDAIEEAWEDGTLDAELYEELFTEDVIGDDIGEGSGDGWGFPGSSYTVAR